jgi:hypothetical protein
MIVARRAARDVIMIASLLGVYEPKRRLFEQKGIVVVTSIFFGY